MDRSSRKEHVRGPAEAQHQAQLTVSGRKGNREAQVRDSAEAYRDICLPMIGSFG